jgi:hypothetical protein
VANLFEDLPAHPDREIVTELLSREGVRIERIVSTGLRIEGEGERELRPGDHVLIPAPRRHWVTWTAKDEPTVWLAVHLR